MNQKEYKAVLKVSDTLFNPYQGLVTEDDGLKASIILPKETMALLRALCPNRGVMQQILTMVIKDLELELQSNNINYYTPANEKFLVEAVKRRCTFTRPS